MPQLIMADMSQFSASQRQIISAAVNQQQQQVKPTPVRSQVAKTKVRRTRQSRNPQLSVARRNERERNRVKMVNNGFAVLRDHLPVEYLALVNGTSQGGKGDGFESGCDTPDVSSVGGGTKSPCPSTGGGNHNNNKSKKFSKVETLRAAIQHIKTLLKLLKDSDPAFESIRQQQVACAEENSNNSHLAGVYDDIDAPLSIGSSSQQQQQQQQMSFQVQYQGGQQARLPVAGEQFVKLEPAAQLYQQHEQLSPFETAQTTIITTTTTSNSPPVSSQSYQSPVRVASNDNNGEQQQQQPASEHTHLWIQQHQNSFIEQQQQQQYNWSPYQQQYTEIQVQQHPQMPSPADSQAGNTNTMQLYQQQQQDQVQFHHSHQQQLDQSPPAHWFTPSPTSQIMMQQHQQQQVAGTNAHQISLYSQ